jgi:hypothetical protein
MERIIGNKLLIGRIIVTIGMKIKASMMKSGENPNNFPYLPK